jgi:hypothetical protein
MIAGCVISGFWETMKDYKGFLRQTALLLLIIALVITACRPASNATPEMDTLGSLRKVDDHPLYTMTYVGDYISATAIRSERTVRVTAEQPTGETAAWACSLFAALGDANAMLYGRNFDWDHSPALLLFTDPPDGYASVSMVDIAYLRFTPAELRDLTALSQEKRRPLLDAPWLPFDGMNEHGLAIGMAAVPASALPHDPAKPTIGSLGIIREMLDHARTVVEAVAVMEGYNVEMEGGPSVHYLIADATGAAVLVEFYRGEMAVIPNTASWHQATNFLRSAVGEASVPGRCGRYDAITEHLAASAGRSTAQDALELLRDVSQPGTQWSVVYGMHTGDVDIVMGRAYDTVHHFQLSLSDTSTP